jgi:hypothetical protein
MEEIPMQLGYSNLHPEARAVAELTELLVRHDILKLRSLAIPGYRPPGDLIKDINQRFASMNEGAKSAVIDLRRVGKTGKAWQAWLKKQLLTRQCDAADLLLLQEHFGGSAAGKNGGAQVNTAVYDKYGPFDRPWRMPHQW